MLRSAHSGSRFLLCRAGGFGSVQLFLLSSCWVVVVLSVSAGASLVVVAALATVVLLLSHVATLHLAAWATLLGALHVEVFHKVLLDLLETSLLNRIFNPVFYIYYY